MECDSNAAQAAQIANDSFRHLTHRTKDVIIAVARACDGMGTIAARLEQDLQQLTEYESF